uniref:Uncharacterized protein n=1 Tax=uncultured Alphaproteobacteria bacterium TaxID=91750 RepID=A0A6G8F366_9PROT|nr:hypothetical protein PlAlph_5240 [uncultured Alphaproteobacteria bacterium]
MSISKTVLSLAATFLVAANINAANAAESGEAVLFKIHDITPVKNSDGEVVGCDYSATFYNRSDITIRNATLNLSWKDTAIDGVIEQEKKEDSVKNRRNISRARSTTERTTDKTVETLLEVPTIKPAKQIVVKSRVNTDRCFLLIDNASFNVKDCNAENATGQAASGRKRGEGGCTRLFSYVSAEDPQYYLEFKAMTVDEEKTEVEEQRTKEKNVADEMYKKSVAAIEATNSIVSGIK